MQRLMRFLKDEDGVTAIEYGLIAALIAVAIITALTLAGEALQGIFGTVQTELEQASDSAAGS
jgi:pilus assembly protein Flp/PilA